MVTWIQTNRGREDRNQYEVFNFQIEEILGGGRKRLTVSFDDRLPDGGIVTKVASLEHGDSFSLHRYNDEDELFECRYTYRSDRSQGCTLVCEPRSGEHARTGIARLTEVEVISAVRALERASSSVALLDLWTDLGGFRREHPSSDYCWVRLQAPVTGIEIIVKAIDEGSRFTDDDLERIRQGLLPAYMAAIGRA